MNTSLAVMGMGGGEMVLIFAAILVLSVAKKIPGFFNGFGQGIHEFRKASRDVQGEFDDLAEDAGRSLGGIYGKPAFEALTPDNQNIEFYDPAGICDKEKTDQAAKKPRLYSLSSRRAILTGVIIGVMLGILVWFEIKNGWLIF